MSSTVASALEYASSFLSRAFYFSRNGNIAYRRRGPQRHRVPLRAHRRHGWPPLITSGQNRLATTTPNLPHTRDPIMPETRGARDGAGGRRRDFNNRSNPQAPRTAVGSARRPVETPWAGNCDRRSKRGWGLPCATCAVSRHAATAFPPVAFFGYSEPDRHVVRQQGDEASSASDPCRLLDPSSQRGGVLVLVGFETVCLDLIRDGP